MMIDRFSNLRDSLYVEKKTEYLNLGEQLKELTRMKIAEKFEIHPAAITAIKQLDMDDFKLIRELIEERQRMIARRKHLRDKYYV